MTNEEKMNEQISELAELVKTMFTKEQLKELISTLSDAGTSIYFSYLKLETLINKSINPNCLTIIYSEIDFANREISKIRVSNNVIPKKQQREIRKL